MSLMRGQAVAGSRQCCRQPVSLLIKLEWIPLGMGKDFFTERVGRHGKSVPKQVGESPSLGVFKKCVDVALQDML